MGLLAAIRLLYGLGLLSIGFFLWLGFILLFLFGILGPFLGFLNLFLDPDMGDRREHQQHYKGDVTVVTVLQETVASLQDDKPFVDVEILLEVELLQPIVP